jgi:hypothetical protein
MTLNRGTDTSLGGRRRKDGPLVGMSLFLVSATVAAAPRTQRYDGTAARVMSPDGRTA